jgi:hypothetical protein
MTGFAAMIAASGALFWALRMAIAGECLLNLRAMARFSLALAVAAAPFASGAVLACAAALAVCRLHPDLRLRPLPPLLLLMLTPAFFLSAAVWLAGGVVPPDATWLPYADAPEFAVPAVLSALLLVHPLLGFGWRFRFAASIFAACMIVGLCSAAAGLAATPALGFAAAAAGILVLAVRLTDRAALHRLGLCCLAMLSAPVLIFRAQAGPWSQAPGDSLVIVRAPVSGLDDGAYGAQSYSETGLADGLTSIATAFQERSGRSAKAGGMVGLRGTLWENEGWIVSAEASAGIEPFSFETGTAAWKRHAQGEVKALAGWGGELEGLPVYVDAGLGWRIRPEEFGDAGLVSVSAGIDLTPSLQFNVHADMELNVLGEDRAFAQAGLLWRLDDGFALEAGVQSFETSTGDTQAQAFAGVWIRF